MIWGFILVIVALMLLGLGVWNASEMASTPNNWNSAKTWKQALWVLLLLAGAGAMFGAGSRNLMDSPSLGG